MDVLNSNKKFVSNAINYIFLILLRKSVSQEVQDAFTTTRPNAFPVRNNTFTTKLNKNASLSVVESTQKMADVLNVLHSLS